MLPLADCFYVFELHFCTWKYLPIWLWVKLISTWVDVIYILKCLCGNKAIDVCKNTLDLILWFNSENIKFYIIFIIVAIVTLFESKNHLILYFSLSKWPSISVRGDLICGSAYHSQWDGLIDTLVCGFATSHNPVINRNETCSVLVYFYCNLCLKIDPKHLSC